MATFGLDDLTDKAIRPLAQELGIVLASKSPQEIRDEIKAKEPQLVILSGTLQVTPTAAAPVPPSPPTVPPGQAAASSAPSPGTANEHDRWLRSEIIESQKTQADFLKWKMISVAGVASVALGISATAGALGGVLLYLLCLVPPICVYVDLISLHLMIRIITIGLYLRFTGNRYELFTFEVRARSSTNPFVFEAATLHGSSAVFNIIIIVLGFILPLWPVAPPQLQAAYLVAGIVGLGFSIGTWFMYGSRASNLQQVAREVLPPQPGAPN
jgi:hypothetical protein